jgi:hypothetical protein
LRPFLTRSGLRLPVSARRYLQIPWRVCLRRQNFRSKLICSGCESADRLARSVRATERADLNLFLVEFDFRPGTRATVTLSADPSAVVARHRMRSAAPRAVPALAVPPIIAMPMLPACSGDGSRGGSYGGAAPTTNGASNNRARNGASCGAALSNGVSDR